jgi:3-isopropylmalate/(R)-2-methylmalate dehydratase large subunit
MGMTVIEKILALHSGRDTVVPGEIVDVQIDARVARDFGGASVVRHMEEHNLELHDPLLTFFTFDCNPTGSDQKYAANQHKCRQYARMNGIRVYDIDRGIGTHVLIEEGLAWPGSTAVSTDSHANILGAVGSFGQGMGDRDIAAAWHRGSTWFRVPPSVKIILEGKTGPEVTAKDIALNLLERFGASSLLGCAIELEGELVDALSMDQRITIASMATEMGAIIILIPPSREVILYCESRSRRKITPVQADRDASYKSIFAVDASSFKPRLSLPGKPHHTAILPEERIWIDSAFIGSCTNGRIGDLRAAAGVLKGRKVAEGVVLKIVPATDRVWQQCLEEGLLEIFKETGALVSNAGCAGCAAGQVGQNGPGEVTIGTGNRNFPGKQGQGEVYLASPAVVAASAIAGYITDPGRIPEHPVERVFEKTKKEPAPHSPGSGRDQRPEVVVGRAWFIPRDNIDTDMIYHNRYLSITNPSEMGRYAFDNLEGWEDFASRVRAGDIVVSGKNFGSGSSRQQAVDCFITLGVQCLIAESFGAIYERNAINAAFPILSSDRIPELKLQDGDELEVNFRTGRIRNKTRNITLDTAPFSEVQMEIYQNNGLF